MIQYYKPNGKVSGHAVSFNLNSKDGKIIVQVIKQTGWNDAEKTGSFKDGAKFNVTFGRDEIGGWLNTIERGSLCKFYHSSAKGDVSIELKQYSQKPKTEGEKAVPNGHTISINPKGENQQSFGFWFNAAEARALKEYLQFSLEKIYSAAYSAEKKQRDEYYKNKEGKAAKSKQAAPSEETSEAEETPEDEAPF